MPIGTSDGEYFETEWDHAISTKQHIDEPVTEPKDFKPNYISKSELMGGKGTSAIAALLQMIDTKGLTPEQLDRKPKMQEALFDKAWKEHPEILNQTKDNIPFSEKANKRWTAEDVNSVMIKFNNWKKRSGVLDNLGPQELTPQERITEGFIDIRNPNSMF